MFIDGHPDFLGEPYWYCAADFSFPGWETPPASYHNGGAGFGFADGHAETKIWRSATSRFPVNYREHYAMAFDAAGLADYRWYLERTGSSTTGPVNCFTATDPTKCPTPGQDGLGPKDRQPEDQ